MKAFFVQTFQKAINRFLALDSHFSEKLAALENKTVTLELLGLGFSVSWVFLGNKITLLSESTLGSSDIIIRGAPFSLFYMAAKKGDRKNMFGEQIVIEGDLELGQKVMDLIDEFDPDWQEYLAKRVGDAPVYYAERTLRHIKKINQRIQTSIVRNTDEYLHEELAWAPSHERLDIFLKDVDSVRMDVDRLEARIDFLNKAIFKQA